MTIIFVDGEVVNVEQLEKKLGPEFKVVPVQVPPGRALHELVFAHETSSVPLPSL